MIRGAIETATSEVVEGWIYAEQADSRDRLLLAFVGKECVGSGTGGLFRHDLADAGLADGYLGFRFPVTVPPEDVPAIVVKFDGSDAVLLQSGAQITAGGGLSGELTRSAVGTQLARLRFALKRARLSQPDFDYLRTIWSFGIYERGLARRNPIDDTTYIEPWEGVARDMFEAYVGIEAELVTTTLGSPSAFKLALTRVARETDVLPIVALHCKERAVLRVSEGSHIKDSAVVSDADRAVRPVEYILGPENILIMDSRVTADLWLPDDVSFDFALARKAKPD